MRAVDSPTRMPKQGLNGELPTPQTGFPRHRTNRAHHRALHEGVRLQSRLTHLQEEQQCPAPGAPRARVARVRARLVACREDRVVALLIGTDLLARTWTTGVDGASLVARTSDSWKPAATRK